VSPRPYRLGRRQVAADETRAQILAAARDVLVSDDAFSMEAVARKADVARMTIYYQFGAKTGLLEALMDDLAHKGEIDRRLPAAFQRPDALAALDAFIAAFVHFWASDRVVIRRLQALAALDPVISEGNETRQAWRRHGARVIVERLAPERGHVTAPLSEAVDTLAMLTSFATYDALATSERTLPDVTSLLQWLARRALGVGEGDRVMGC
jgi:AcrR family transcriptional regulator